MAPSYMAGSDPKAYSGPDRRSAVREHRFHLRRRDAWARALTPLWFLALLVGLYGMASPNDHPVHYVLAAVALAGTLGSTWMLSRTAYRWQFRRRYRWWVPRDHVRAHAAYRNFKGHYPVLRAWHDVLARRAVPVPVGGSRQEDRPEPSDRKRRSGRNRPAARHGWPGDR